MSVARLRGAFLCAAAPFCANAAMDADALALIQRFEMIRTNTVFPVEGASLDDIEETFGPRIQPSADRYDWHRGIDVDGANGSNIVAALDGRLHRVTNSASGGHT